jgi:hypothetical protein
LTEPKFKERNHDEIKPDSGEKSKRGMLSSRIIFMESIPSLRYLGRGLLGVLLSSVAKGQETFYNCFMSLGHIRFLSGWAPLNQGSSGKNL